MAEKIYIIEHLGCANCAAKMESRIQALPQVQAASITFATRQLRVQAEDPDALLPELQRIVSSMESDAVIRQRTQTCHAHEESCTCCHAEREDHHHDHHTEKEERGLPLLLGAVLLVAGLVLDRLGLGIPGAAVYVAAYVLLGWRILATAGRNLCAGHIFDENFLMSLATLGAFAIGEFPEAVGVMLFYRVGEFFEHRAVERSRSQIMAAVDLRPETVNRLEGTQLQQIPAEQAAPGDLLAVRPGDRIPLDGVVVTGQSRIDTSPITGEPVPVRVCVGDSVISGCINQEQLLTVRVTKPLSESTVTRILHAVESAAAGKPRIDRFITRFARIYTPVVVAVAVITAIVPSVITGQWKDWIYTALSFLVMSCPCALVLSVPLAFFSGIGVAGRQGILFKGGASIEALASVRVAALDKTGTVTEGDFRLQHREGTDTLLLLAAACEQYSTHPIARSITDAARQQGMIPEEPESLEELPGQGIRAVIAGRTVLCGNRTLMERFGVSVPTLPHEQGSQVLVAQDGQYLGYLLVADSLKHGAPAAVEQLKRMGITAAMLTGDSPENAQAVAERVGIRRVYARLLPQQKLERLQSLRTEHGPVLFVGDGINDAPVLAGADVGAAMGSGADAAIEAADLVFVTSDVAAIPKAVAIARRTRAIAWQNVIFALSIKLLVMGLGLLGYASMWLAVFADSGVALLCVLNAIRQLYGKGKNM